MSRRAILFACCGIILVLSMALVVVNDPFQVVSGFARGESFYRGRPASYWREQIVEAISAKSSLQALEAMFENGWASDVLIECANDRDKKVRAISAMLLADSRYSPQVIRTLKRLLKDPEEIVVKASVQSLVAFGGRSKPAVPELLALADGANEYLQPAARTALWSIDQQAAIKLECWEKVDREDLEFSAELPAPISVDESPVATSSGDLAIARFESQTGLTFYSIAVSEMLPEAVEAMKAEGWFDEHVRKSAENQQSKAVNQETITHHGQPAYCWTLRKKASDGPLEMDVQIRAIPIGNRLYQAVVVFPTDEPPNGRAVAFFLDSFVIRREAPSEE